MNNNEPVTRPLLTIESAAKQLAVSPEALRARCRRHVDKQNPAQVHLGPGIVALKFGSSWRVAITPLPVAFEPTTVVAPVISSEAPVTPPPIPSVTSAIASMIPLDERQPVGRPRRFHDSPSPVRFCTVRRKWRIDFRYTDSTGARRRYRQHSTVQTATGAHTEAERLMLLARTTGAVPSGGAPTFAEFVTHYFEKVYIRTRCRPSTIERYKALMGQGLLEFFGNKRIDMIFGHDFRQYSAILHTRGVGVKAHLSLARTVLRAAVEAGHLARLPSLPTLPRPGKKLPVAPPAAAIHTLLTNTSGWMRSAIALAAYAGLRSGEVRALEVQDVALIAGIVSVRRAFSADEVLSPKSGDERVVPLVDRLREIVASSLEGKAPRDRVVIPTGDATLTRQHLLHAFHRVQAPLIERKLLDRRWSFHHLRHLFCSELVRRGASIEAVRLLAGHAEIKTTMRYVHAHADELRATMSKLDDA